MSRTVFCRKYQQELPGLTQAPFPGAKGQDILDNISAKAWQEWMAHQTMLINEKQLNLMDTGTRVYLGEQMTKFLSGEEYDAAEGYVPPEQNKD
ncbi:oxidative damage protection protein [Gilvimarinus agarilyticus]|uniref:oxidative damage protection protein n=1 Tax=unclassified Gilvimarinus TaxID=2642066 RepID=UPI001C084511|nr:MULTISPECIES: oxidative damage protection protein [unclassified Gilvimarinus]MBU2886571.1 oxidative damage protection protein [Gilvimarinus agarilyticus]MDO6571239.1 oxidative damage protection protein [Gilvimarinus sp. 2_MG-2023]MDO6746387.1 oxidative damage protection protein [Gilvimarinus sp. 1_MG-2023]